MPTTATTAPGRAVPGSRSPWRRVLPGLMICLAVAVLAQGVAGFVPGLSPLILAILAGILMANLAPLPDGARAGTDFAAKKLLRAGIVLLGLQLVLADILALGAPMLLVVVAVVGGGLAGTVMLGRLLGVDRRLTLLVACGFSICGAAAVAAAAGVTDPDDEHEERTVTAVALVVLCGTLMIALVPAVASLLGMTSATAGLWAGGSIHEIAQVVAAGGLIGGGALTIAVVVKLARVLMLAPVIAALSIAMRRRGRTAAAGSGAPLPPIIPWFVLGFLAMVLLRSFAPLPAVALDVGGVVQTTLLAAAMFALGCGVRIRQLLRVGVGTFLLAAGSTVLVASIAAVGVALTA